MAVETKARGQLSGRTAVGNLAGCSIACVSVSSIESSTLGGSEKVAPRLRIDPSGFVVPSVKIPLMVLLSGLWSLKNFDEVELT